jgi:hypothetical protein
MVMESALRNRDLVFVESIDNPVLLVYAPRPIPLEIKLQWLWLAYALRGVFTDFQA